MRATHLAWRCLSSLGNHSHSRPKLSCIAINNRRFNKDSSSTSGGGDYVIIGSESNKKSQTAGKPLELHGVAPTPRPDPERLQRELAQKIKFGGPITVYQYMQEVLTNPVTGYYTGKDEVLGARGDFVTSPEISQMFGECVAVWLVHEWMKMGAPKPLNLVELGPGSGALMSDILRVFAKLVPEDLPSIGVHLVETSPKMRALQEKRLKGFSKLTFHHRLDQVPKEFSFFLAHEFFDALPIHKFVKATPEELKAAKERRPPSSSENGASEWREVLVDVDSETGGLRFVRSRHETPATALIDPELNPPRDEDMDGVEISPKASSIVSAMSQRIDEFGGAALIGDYGNDYAPRDTFRGFRGHSLHDVLTEPGTADLTADVDFLNLKRSCSEHTICYGPVEQGDFLRAMGIEVRLQKLTQSTTATEEAKAQLKSAYDMLVSPDQMGKRFKFMSVFPKTMSQIHSKFPPAGFYPQK